MSETEHWDEEVADRLIDSMRELGWTLIERDGSRIMFVAPTPEETQ